MGAAGAAGDSCCCESDVWVGEDGFGGDGRNGCGGVGIGTWAVLGAFVAFSVGAMFQGLRLAMAVIYGNELSR